MNHLSLRERRQLKGWTLEYVAKQIGTTKQNMQRYEQGTRQPKPLILFKICKLFDIEHEEIAALLNIKND